MGFLRRAVEKQQVQGLGTADLLGLLTSSSDDPVDLNPTAAKLMSFIEVLVGETQGAGSFILGGVQGAFASVPETELLRTCAIAAHVLGRIVEDPTFEVAAWFSELAKVPAEPGADKVSGDGPFLAGPSPVSG